MVSEVHSGIVVSNEAGKKQTSIRREWKVTMKFSWMIGLLVLAASAAPMKPDVAKFMQAMDAGMKQMDRDMAAATMNGNIDHDFATMTSAMDHETTARKLALKQGLGA